MVRIQPYTRFQHVRIQTYALANIFQATTFRSSPKVLAVTLALFSETPPAAVADVLKATPPATRAQKMPAMSPKL
jgi:hypothetical protein